MFYKRLNCLRSQVGKLKICSHKDNSGVRSDVPLTENQIYKQNKNEKDYDEIICAGSKTMTRNFHK